MIAMQIGSPTEALNRVNWWIFTAKKIKIIIFSSRNGTNNKFQTRKSVHINIHRIHYESMNKAYYYFVIIPILLLVQQKKDLNGML